MTKRGPLILIPHTLGPNLFLAELGTSYVRLGYRVVVGRENLDYDLIDPDAVHIQWPEEFYRWTGRGLPEARVKSFLAALDRCKSRGARITWSVHNLRPHDTDDEIDRLAYQGVIDRADVIGHYCERSKALMRSGTKFRPVFGR